MSGSRSARGALGGRGAPVPASRSAVFPLFLATMAVVHGVLAVTWWAPATPGRAAGVDWVGPWMSPSVVAALWTVAAVAAGVGVVLAVRCPRAARGALVWIGVLLVIIPSVIGAYFLGSTVVWHWSHEDVGSPSGWITAATYLGRGLISLWALGLHVGVFDQPLRREDRDG